MGGLVGGAISAAGSIFGSNKAAEAQAKATQESLKLQKEMFAQTQQNLAPFIQGGGNVFSQLQGLLPELTADFAPTMEQLMATPGYQFTLQEGLKAAQNGYAAQGLGQSGAAMKGAEQYATGLASQTFQQQFQNYLAQQQQKYNMYLQPSQIGANAAAGLGQISGNAAQNMAGTITGGGNAQAAMWNNTGNAIGNFGNLLGGQAMATGNWNNFGLGGGSGTGTLGSGSTGFSLYGSSGLY